MALMLEEFNEIKDEAFTKASTIESLIKDFIITS